MNQFLFLATCFLAYANGANDKFKGVASLFGSRTPAIEAHHLRVKSKYGGMEVSEAQEVKQLREENARLKKLVADLSLDKDMLQSVIRKNSLARRTESGSAAAAGRVYGKRAPRLRADGDSANELPISERAR